MTHPRPDAATAWVQLLKRIEALDDQDRATPCRIDPEPFTSDDRRDRVEAALACQPCPARIECGRYALANREPAHVWAGHDLTGRPGHQRPYRALERELHATTRETETTDA